MIGHKIHVDNKTKNQIISRKDMKVIGYSKYIPNRMDKRTVGPLFKGIICNLLMVDSGFHEAWSIPKEYKNSMGERIVESHPGANLLIQDTIYLGIIIGSLIPLFAWNKYNNRIILILATMGKVFSGFLASIRNDLAFSYTGRIIAGIGCGITYAVLPMYLRKIIDQRMRRSVGVLTTVFMNIGILLFYATPEKFFVEYTAFITIGIPVVFGIGAIWLPDDTFNYTSENQIKFTSNLLESQNLADGGYKTSINMRRALKSSFKNLFCNKSNRKALFSAMLLLSGMTVIGTASVSMYQKLMLHENVPSFSSHTINTLHNIFVILGSFTCFVLVQNYKKRKLLEISAGLCLSCLSLFFIFIFVRKTDQGNNLLYNIALIGHLGIQAFGYGFGLNALPFLHIMEGFGWDVRGPAGFLCNICYATTKFTASQSIQVVQRHFDISGFVALVFIVSSILIFLIVCYEPLSEDKKSEDEVQPVDDIEREIE